jgi:hypothetical protein
MMKFLAAIGATWNFLKEPAWLVRRFVMETNKTAILYKVT